MAELRIRFRRPDSMSESELADWIRRRVRGREPLLARTRLDGSDNETLVLRVRVPQANWKRPRSDSAT